jgi:CMP-N-acetylneuraminic acid synthetase
MIVAIIPARKGSKGIAGKNIKPLQGKPLIEWTIEAALRSVKIDLIAISTDDPKIFAMKKKYQNIIFIDRPKYLSSDSVSSHDVILHAIRYLETSLSIEPNLVATLQPTSPLRTNFHIDAAIELFFKNNNADSLVSCVKVPHNFEKNSQMVLEGDYFLKAVQSDGIKLRRQDKNSYYARNGAAVYITKRTSLDKYIWGGSCLGYEMNIFESIDIDSIEDFIMAEMFMHFRELGNFEDYFHS